MVDDIFNAWYNERVGDNYPNQAIWKSDNVNDLEQDLYYVLVEKTSGESAIKVKSVEEGKGIHAYFKIYWWFVKTSGIAIHDRSRKAMLPEAISKEENISTQLEAWEADNKVLQAQGKHYELNDHMKMIALEIMFSVLFV